MAVLTDLYTGYLGNPAVSTSTQTVGPGNQIFTLDYDDGSFQIDYVVQILCLDDPSCWEYGVIVGKDTSALPVRITVAIFKTSQLTNTSSNWQLQVLPGTPPGVPPSQGFSLDSTDSFTVPALGTTLNLTTDTGKIYAFGDSIYVQATVDRTSWFIGVVITYNSGTGAISLFVTRTSSSGLTYQLWTLSLITVAGANAAQINFSSTSNTIPTSLPSDKTFTVAVSGQYFPIQGPVLITSLASPTNFMEGIVKAYSGTTMIVTVLSKQGSGTSNSWEFENLGPPQTRISLYQMNGLNVSQVGNGTSSFIVTKGSVRDSQDLVDLILPSSVTIDMASPGAALVQPQLAGTVGTNGLSTTNITGSGTSFTTDFSVTGTLTDFNNQLTNTGQSTVSFATTITITSEGHVHQVGSVTNNTSLALSAFSENFPGTSQTYFRNSGLSVTELFGYGVLLARKDSDGTTGIFLTAFTVSGNPDLPSGYTSYRVIASIAAISHGGSTASMTINQPLVAVYGGVAGQTLVSNGTAFIPSNLGPKALWSGIITPTNPGGSISSVDAVNDIITWSIAHGLSTGENIRFGGTTPAGVTTGTTYYINALSSTTFSLYTLYTDALIDNNRVNITGTTAGATINHLVYTNVFSIGFSTIAPVAGTPGSTTMKFDFNLTTPVSTTLGILISFAAGLFTSTPAQVSGWYQNGTAHFASTVLVQLPSNDVLTITSAYLNITGASTILGTWTNQGSTAFGMQAAIWG